MSNQKLEWVTTEIDGLSIIVVRDTNQPDGLRTPSPEECARAVRLLNEEGNTVVRLYCQTPDCPDKGGWIERTRKQAETQVFQCAVCGKKMER